MRGKVNEDKERALQATLQSLFNPRESENMQPIPEKQTILTNLGPFNIGRSPNALLYQQLLYGEIDDTDAVLLRKPEFPVTPYFVSLRFKPEDPLKREAVATRHFHQLQVLLRLFQTGYMRIRLHRLFRINNDDIEDDDTEDLFWASM